MPGSSYEVPVIQVKLETHPNADKLALVKIDDIRVVGVRKEEWKDGDLGAFIQADMVVPETGEFAWVGPDRRIRPRKFRGVMSWGILVPAPAGSSVGDDVAGILGVVRYEPPQELSRGGDQEKAPSLVVPIYDLEAYYKYHNLFQLDEPVVITEKVHGENFRAVFWDNEMHVGTHRTWKKKGDDLRWKVLDRYPQVEIYCRIHEGHVVYGETFGYLDLKYDIEAGDFCFRVFDIRTAFGWVPAAEVFCCTGMPMVPLLYRGPYRHELVQKYTDGQSVLAAGQIREGCVISPEVDRYDPEIGRVKLKSVSMEYLERRGKK